MPMLDLYEMWLPLFKAMQEKTVSADTYKDMTDPKKYKEMLDRVFGFDPDAVSEAAIQASKFLEAFAGSAQEFMKPWMEASREKLEILSPCHGRPARSVHADL